MKTFCWAIDRFRETVLQVHWHEPKRDGCPKYAYGTWLTRDQFFGFQRFLFRANGAPLSLSFPGHDKPDSHKTRFSLLPWNPLSYSPLSHLTLLNRILRHHESLCLELFPMRHLINVPPCRYPLIPPYVSESRATFSDLLGYDIRKGEWNPGGGRGCR